MTLLQKRDVLAIEKNCNIDRTINSSSRKKRSKSLVLYGYFIYFVN